MNSNPSLDIKNISLSRWAQSILFLNGAPFSLADRDYIKPVYDDGYIEFLLMAGRQTEKSSTEAAMAVSLACAFHTFQLCMELLMLIK